MPEGAGAFGGFIGPATLLGLVANTAPWLFSPAEPARRRPSPGGRSAGPLQWRGILRAGEGLEPNAEPKPAERTDYFALCLAAHFASAATYVPTDVDTKIRRALWREAIGTGELARMRGLALGLARADLREVSARWLAVAGEGVSPDGERLSDCAAAWSRRARRPAGTARTRARDAIDAEPRASARIRAAREGRGRGERPAAPGERAHAQRRRRDAGLGSAPHRASPTSRAGPGRF
jgi:hypothetical protein